MNMCRKPEFHEKIKASSKSNFIQFLKCHARAICKSMGPIDYQQVRNDNNHSENVGYCSSLIDSFITHDGSMVLLYMVLALLYQHHGVPHIHVAVKIATLDYHHDAMPPGRRRPAGGHKFANPPCSRSAKTMCKTRLEQFHWQKIWGKPILCHSN